MTTTTQKHSMEPWSAFDDDGTGTLPGILSDKVNAGGNFYVAQFRNFNDAVHAAACVNGCNEINPETVPEMLRCLKCILQCLDDEVDRLPPGTLFACKGLRGNIRDLIAKANYWR